MFIDQMLNRLRESTEPALTWYAPAGERVELSGRVLDNWVAKSASLLLEEFDVEPGSRLSLALPAHWKSLVLATAALEAGATVCGADADDADVFASDDARLLGSARAPLGVALGALELEFGGDLPAGAVDYAANVRMYADSFGRFSDPAGTDPALELPGQAGSTVVSFASLESWCTQGNPAASSRPAISSRVGWEKALRVALASWNAGGSLVLYSEELESKTQESDGGSELSRIFAQENATPVKL